MKLSPEVADALIEEICRDPAGYSRQIQQNIGSDDILAGMFLLFAAIAEHGGQNGGAYLAGMRIGWSLACRQAEVNELERTP